MKKEKIIKNNEIRTKKELISYIINSIANALEQVYVREKNNIDLNKTIIKKLRKTNIEELVDLNFKLIINKFFQISGLNWDIDYKTHSEEKKNILTGIIKSSYALIIEDIVKIKFNLIEEEKMTTVKNFLAFSKILLKKIVDHGVSRQISISNHVNGVNQSDIDLTNNYEFLRKKASIKIEEINMVKLLIKKIHDVIEEEKQISIKEISNYLIYERIFSSNCEGLLKDIDKEDKRLKRFLINNQEFKDKYANNYRKEFREKYTIKEKKEIREECNKMSKKTKKVYMDIVNNKILDKSYVIDLKSLNEFDQSFLMENEIVKNKNSDLNNNRNLIREMIIINSLNLDFYFDRDDLFDFRNEELKEFKLINFKEKINQGDNISLYIEITESVIKFIGYKNSGESNVRLGYITKSLYNKLNTINENKNALLEANIHINFYNNMEICKSKELSFLGEDAAVIEVICKEKELDLYEDIISNFINKKIELILKEMNTMPTTPPYMGRIMRRASGNNKKVYDLNGNKIVDIDVMGIINEIRKVELTHSLEKVEVERTIKKKKI
jgi:hypothetical protein